DRSPIIGLTPVPGLYVNCGWGTGGFKATPGSGHVFAATIAKGEPHPIAAPFNLDRFRTGRLIDEDWAAFLYLRDNPKGLHFERWRHIHGCGRFFNAARDTVSDKFLASYKAGQKRPEIPR